MKTDIFWQLLFFRGCVVCHKKMSFVLNGLNTQGICDKSLSNFVEAIKRIYKMNKNKQIIEWLVYLAYALFFTVVFFW